MGLENVAEMKSYRTDSEVDFSGGKNVSLTLKIGLLRLCSLSRKKNMDEDEQKLGGLIDPAKQTNNYNENGKREKGGAVIFEILATVMPNLMRNINIHIKEFHLLPSLLRFEMLGSWVTGS